jgi:hypothetical protein
MDNKTAKETASRLYSATTALLGIFDDNTGTRAISQEDVRRILSMPAGKLSIASVETTGADRASRFATDLQDNLFPHIPKQATITGIILAIYSAGDMTTEEYQVICNKLLGNYPDDIQTIVSLSLDERVAADCFKGTFLVSWEI